MKISQQTNGFGTFVLSPCVYDCKFASLRESLDTSRLYFPSFLYNLPQNYFDVVNHCLPMQRARRMSAISYLSQYMSLCCAEGVRYCKGNCSITFKVRAGRANKYLTRIDYNAERPSSAGFFWKLDHYSL